MELTTSRRKSVTSLPAVSRRGSNVLAAKSLLMKCARVSNRTPQLRNLFTFSSRPLGSPQSTLVAANQHGISCSRFKFIQRADLESGGSPELSQSGNSDLTIRALLVVSELVGQSTLRVAASIAANGWGGAQMIYDVPLD